MWNNPKSEQAYRFAAMFTGLPAGVREKRLVLVLQGYFDDSGSEPSSAVYVLAGFIAPAENWVRFSDDWQAVLNKPPAIRVFKASPANALDGEFASGWTKPLMDQRVLELVEVIKAHVTYRIHTGVAWRDYAAFVGSIVQSCTSHDPYNVCFLEILGAISTAFPGEFIEPIFDDQGAIGTKVLNLWDNWPLRKSGIFANVEKPAFKTDALVVPLQAADLYAWNIFQEASKVTNGRQSNASKHIIKMLESIPCYNRVLSREFLMKLGAGLLARREIRSTMTLAERLNETPCPNCGGPH